MPKNPLFYSVDDPVKAGDLRDQIQIALAIADPNLLQSLLIHCLPPLSDQHHIGTISAQVGVPAGSQHTADGVLHFEAIQCVLAEAQRSTAHYSSTTSRARESRELAKLIRHESEMHTLAQNLALAPMVSLLAESGFTPEQVDEILRLPQDGWHKSWWHTTDSSGNFTVPFLRHMRLLHYPDGTLTIQYKDFFGDNKPRCFASLPQKVLIVTRPEQQRFGETLQQINYQREALGIAQAVLICHRISELEAQGFIHQGISVYPAVELVLPIQANCHHCGRKECPMNGAANSPIALCYGFLPESEYV